MGIFDNVNWQQMLPVAMSAFAGGMDPNHSQQLGQSGWNAVQNYMMQQRMQQEQQQQQERRKMQQQEMQQQERRTKIAESQEQRSQEEQLQDEFLAKGMGGALSILEKNPNAGMSGVWKYYNDLAKESGVKLSQSKFVKMWENSKMISEDEGSTILTYDEKTGGLKALTRRKVGGKNVDTPYNILDRGLSMKDVELWQKSPEIMLQVADSIKDRAPELAKTFQTMANRILQDKGARDLSATKMIISKMEHDHKVAIDTIEARYGKKDPVTGNYPGAPEDPQKAKEYNAMVDKARSEADGIYYEGTTAVINGIMTTPSGRKEAEKQIKTLDEPFEATGRKKELYVDFMRALKDNDKLSWRQKVAIARAATTHVVENPVPEKKPVSEKKPKETQKGETSIGPPSRTPQSGPYDWSAALPFGGLGMNELGRSTSQAMDYMGRVLTPRQRPPRGWQGY